MAVTPFKVNEGTSAQYTGQLVDETGSAISGNSLNSLKLTLYDKSTGTILNSRNKQNVLNGNNVTVNSTGYLVWTLSAADNAIVANPAGELHCALFEWEWSIPTKSGKREVLIQVTALDKTP